MLPSGTDLQESIQLRATWTNNRPAGRTAYDRLTGSMRADPYGGPGKAPSHIAFGASATRPRYKLPLLIEPMLDLSIRPSDVSGEPA
jgi:hypothetical protein